MRTGVKVVVGSAALLQPFIPHSIRSAAAIRGEQHICREREGTAALGVLREVC